MLEAIGVICAAVFLLAVPAILLLVLVGGFLARRA